MTNKEKESLGTITPEHPMTYAASMNELYKEVLELRGDVKELKAMLAELLNKGQ